MPSTTIDPVSQDNALWRGADLDDTARWTWTLSDEDNDDLARAVAHARAGGKDLLDVTAADFPLPHLRPRLLEVQRELHEGLGLAVITGLQAGTRFDDDDQQLIFWGIGRHLGEPVSQNARGHLLGHVTSPAEHGAGRRQYEDPGPLHFHNDRADVVGLLCLRAAAEGGESLVASALAVHNVMLAERPDLLELLYEPFLGDSLGENVVDNLPFFPTRVFAQQDGAVACNLSTRRIREAQRFPEVPRLTERHIEAFDYVEALPSRPELHHSMLLGEGDMQFLNNYVTLHARTGYLDHDDPDRRRHLVRLWLNLPLERPLTDEFAVHRLGVRPADA